MGKKRKHSEAEAATREKKEEEVAPERPKRTLSGWKEKKDDQVNQTESTTFFRNKEKVLVTCSRRISYRYRHLMLNVVDLLPHCKKDNKVESKSSNGATLNELVDLKSCSSCMFFEIFGIPKEHRKSKPYHDHVFVFSIVDDHIWFRNYQVGPRFCLNPIKIFGGSFGGPTLYENPFYISPNQIRALEKKKKAGHYVKKVKAKTRRKMHELDNPLEADEFSEMWKE
ncbi:Ribosomal RNA processing Brix domain protein [Prunus dulcis]|uniref:Ribosomal RNA processing Brix domain protein n=1 Tax=Prunus dulcis TaxID=3755 RepID=A0A4Y1RCQ7_PRUDU|nr:Ribosomal RNA processing Brix domain protein [Prunus dulcis]